jgi:cytochrome c oxidase assembly protein subunit 15
MIGEKKHTAFKKLSLATLIAVYFLILVGGIVRSTGSGMGCPDWPKCFGNWVPPTDVSQLPDDYKEYYASYRHEKNVRFARYLDLFGMKDKAEKIISDESIREEADFNVYKTWTEYVNRLVGATIGLLIFATMIGSMAYLKEDKVVFYIAVLNFIAVGFQGWIGSVVVSTNLMPWLITFHMVLALIIVLLLIYLNFRIRKDDLKFSGTATTKNLVVLSIVCLAALGVQIVLGTQVREAIDEVAAELSFTFRDTWVSKTGLSFLVHRSFSLVLLALHGGLLYIVMKNKHHSGLLKNIGKYVILLLVIEIASGVIMAYFSIPPFVQPVHLLLSTVSFGVLYYLYLVIVNSKNKIATS